MVLTDFLLELYKEARTARMRRAFEELRNVLNERDLERILDSSREFRRGFKLK